MAKDLYQYDYEHDRNIKLRDDLRSRIQAMAPSLDSAELTTELRNAYAALFGPGNLCK